MYDTPLYQFMDEHNHDLLKPNRYNKYTLVSVFSDCWKIETMGKRS